MKRLHFSIGLAAVAAGVAFAPGAHAAPVVITTCGQVVQGIGILAADLDCSGVADDAVKLRGRLLLSGFTLTGNPAFDVVRCQSGPCRVDGPGTITGGADGVRSDGPATVNGATISGNAGDGVRTDRASRLVGSQITSNGGDGVRAKTSATIKDSSVGANAGDGVRADRSARLSGATISGNGGSGVDADVSSALRSSSVVTNGLDGVKSPAISLSDSSATGNGTSPACGVTEECADLASEKRPALRGTSTCDTSRNTDLGGTWGVCQND
jgi:hypothetical protein